MPCRSTIPQAPIKLFPSSGLVIGFQYRGELAALKDSSERKLNTADITGMADGYKIFKNSAGIGTILVYFTETGFIHFASHPANELFNLSLSLEDIFPGNRVDEVEEKLAAAQTDKQRINVVEQFLLAQLKDIAADKLVVEAVYSFTAPKGRSGSLNSSIS